MAFGDLTVYAREGERKRLNRKDKKKKKKEIEFSEYLHLTTVLLCFTTVFCNYVLKIPVIAKTQYLFVL